MHRSHLAVALLAIALATPIASAQQQDPTNPPPPAQTEAALVGLQVYSADGQKLGMRRRPMTGLLSLPKWASSSVSEPPRL